jgi:hypothetical protein
MSFWYSFLKDEANLNANATFQPLENHKSHLTCTKIITLWDAMQRVIAAKLNTLSQKTVKLWHLLAENCTTCCSWSWWWVQELLNITLYFITEALKGIILFSMHNLCQYYCILNLTNFCVVFLSLDSSSYPSFQCYPFLSFLTSPQKLHLYYRR